MSLLSPDRFIAVLGAEGVGLCRRQGRQQQWLASASFDAPREQIPEVALGSLGGLLTGHASRGGHLTVVLAAQYCRFCLVPWSEGITHPQEFELYARACFERCYGQALDDWHLVLSAEPAGSARIAVAVPEVLLQGLAALCRSQQLKLVSVQPYLMAACNHFAGQLPANDFLFVLAEPQRSVFLLARKSGWQQIRSQGISHDDQDLAALLARECRLQAEQGALRLFVHAPARRAPRPLLDEVELLELEEPGDLLCSMARVVA